MHQTFASLFNGLAAVTTNGPGNVGSSDIPIAAVPPDVRSKFMNGGGGDLVDSTTTRTGSARSSSSHHTQSGGHPEVLGQAWD